MSADLQAQVQAALDRLVASGAEIGLQAAVVHEGHLVVDAAAGVADQRAGEPVSAGTLFFAASTGKGVASTVAHVLVERGELAYDQCVAGSPVLRECALQPGLIADALQERRVRLRR